MSMAYETLPLNGDTFLQQEFLNLQKKHKIDFVIETGTYKGMTTSFLGNNFRRVFTIEINETYYQEAQANLIASGCKNVVSYLGDSRTVLPHVLNSPELTDKTILVFLDAHWYENPVLEELRIIAECSKNNQQKIILMIHDFKNPLDDTMGYDVYPDQGIVYEYSWVQELIQGIYGHDFIISYPKQSAGARRGTLIVEPQEEMVMANIKEVSLTNEEIIKENVLSNKKEMAMMHIEDLLDPYSKTGRKIIIEEIVSYGVANLPPELIIRIANRLISVEGNLEQIIK